MGASKGEIKTLPQPYPPCWCPQKSFNNTQMLGCIWFVCFSAPLNFLLLAGTGSRSEWKIMTRFGFVVFPETSCAHTHTKRKFPDLTRCCRALRAKQTLIPRAWLEAVEAKTSFVLHNIYAVYLWCLHGPRILWNLTITTFFINIYSPSIPVNEKSVIIPY